MIFEYFCITLSNILQISAIYFGVKNFKLIRYNKLWNTAWLGYIIGMFLIGTRRLYSFFIDCNVTKADLIFVVLISAFLCIFGLYSFKFFEKYLKLNRERVKELEDKLENNIAEQKREREEREEKAKEKG